MKPIFHNGSLKPAFAKILATLTLAPFLSLAAQSPTVGFDTAVRPFLQQHCTKCHGEKKQAGKLALHPLDGSLASEKSREVWARVAEKLWLGEMPPEGEPRPSPHASGRVVNWLSAEFARAGHKLTPGRGPASRATTWIRCPTTRMS